MFCCPYLPSRHAFVEDFFESGVWVTDRVLERMEAELHRGENAWGVRSLGLGTAGIQVARYGPEHHYEWHTDSSAPVGGPTQGRVLSVTVQLTSPTQYRLRTINVAFRLRD